MSVVNRASPEYRAAWETYANATVAFAKTGLPARTTALVTALFQSTDAPLDVYAAAVKEDRGAARRRADLCEALGVNDLEELAEDRGPAAHLRHVLGLHDLRELRDDGPEAA